jgi:hypothetical protein
MSSFALPVAGGPPQPLCARFCIPRWSPDGKRLYLPITSPQATRLGRTAMIPLRDGQALPDFPGDGFSRPSDLDSIAGVEVIEGGSDSADYRITGLSPSPDRATFAYVKANVHHNLFRIDIR